MMTLLTTPGFQLKEAARLDGKKRGGEEREKRGLAEEDRKQGGKKKGDREKGVGEGKTKSKKILSLEGIE